MKLVRLSILLLVLVVLILVGCEVPTTGQAVAPGSGPVSKCTLQGNCNAITKITNDVNALKTKDGQHDSKDTQHDMGIDALKAMDQSLLQNASLFQASINSRFQTTGCIMINVVNSNTSHDQDEFCRGYNNKRCAAVQFQRVKIAYSGSDCTGDIKFVDDDTFFKSCRGGGYPRLQKTCISSSNSAIADYHNIINVDYSDPIQGLTPLPMTNIKEELIVTNTLCCN